MEVVDMPVQPDLQQILSYPVLPKKYQNNKKRLL